MKEMNSVLIVVVCLFLAGTAHAVVLFDNFGTGTTYDAAQSQDVSFHPVSDPGYTQETDVDLAMAFTMGANDYSLLSVTLPLGNDFGTTIVDVSIHADNAGLPGTTLESWTLAFLVGGDLTLSSASNPYLSAGATYWVVVSAPGPNSNGIRWFRNSIGYTGPGASRTLLDGAGDWTPSASFRTALRVNGSRVAVDNERASFGEIKALYR